MAAGPLAVVLAAGVVVLGARLFAFRAGAALADAGDPGLGKSLLLTGVGVGLNGGLVALLWEPAGRLDGNPAGFGPARGLGVAAGGAVAAVACGLLYTAALPTTARKGLVLAGYETALGLLLAALVAGVALVVGAAVQMAKRPEPSRSEAPAAPDRPSPPAGSS